MRNQLTRPTQAAQAALAAMLLVAFFSTPAFAAGKFQFVTGDVKVLGADGHERAAKTGEPVIQGETLVSGKPALAQIKMDDGGVLLLWPNSRLKIAVYQYNGKADGKERAEYALARGGVRSITGEIGKVNRDNYKMQTPVAYIGVRGTDHETVYIPPPLNGEIPLGPPGVYDKVNVGETYLKNGIGQIIITPNKVGYAPSATSAPAVLPGIPDFFNAAPKKAKSKSGEGDDAAVKQNIKLTRPASVGAYTAGGGASVGISGTNVSYDPGNAHLANQGANATHGVNWGRFENSATGSYEITGQTAPTSGSLHFINSNNLTNASQLNALGSSVVTATYNHVGGTNPTDHLGGVGTMNFMQVNVNFATQNLTANTLDFSTPGRDWLLGGSGSFTQFGGGGITLTGTCTGCAAGAATGTLNGAFVGNAAQGMITGFGANAGTDSAAGTALLQR